MRPLAMRLCHVRLCDVRRGASAVVGTLLLIAGVGCSSRNQPADSSASQDAVRGDSIGDLTGAPRSTDSAARASRAGESIARPAPPRRQAPNAPSTSASRPVSPPAPAADTGAQHRNDGSMMDPPIHRTNPRDDDIFRPDAPGAGTDQRSTELFAEIRALAKPEGCASAGQCRSLPIGRKACGGPRAYVVYCPRSTNEGALKAKIAELERVDLEAAKHTVSDCMLVVAPRIVVSGGACRPAP